MGTQARDVVAEAVDDSAPAGTNTDHVTDSILAALSEAGFVVVPTSGEGFEEMVERGAVGIRAAMDANGRKKGWQCRGVGGADEIARIAFRSALTPGGET